MQTVLQIHKPGCKNLLVLGSEALREREAAFVNTKEGDATWKVYDSINGHTTDVEGPKYGQFIFKAKRVEVNRT